METLLKELSDKIEVNLTEEQISKFITYKELLKDWNQKINLTAITEDSEIVLKHFVDSLTVLKYIPQNANVIDVGTGAGFPGIPTKIAREDVSITLLDSLNKRINFLNDVIEKTNLENIKTVHGRAEDFGQNKEYRERYDVAVARAVANLSTLTELCLPFVKVSGSFIAMKGNSTEEFEEAQKAIEMLGGKIEKIDKFNLPGTDIERNIVVIKKINKTPNQYPRKAGTPANKPIK